MSLAEHYQLIESERLRAALADAIAYLKLMPRAPVTSAKIAELEKVVNQPVSVGWGAEDRDWKIERVTPAGKSIRIRFADGHLRFETETPLNEGATFGEQLTVDQLDALIDALVAWRKNRI